MSTPSKETRRRSALVTAVVVLAAVLCSLTGPLTVAAREHNGFMVGFVTLAMIGVLVAEGVFLGKLLALGRAGR